MPDWKPVTPPSSSSLPSRGPLRTLPAAAFPHVASACTHVEHVPARQAGQATRWPAGFAGDAWLRAGRTAASRACGRTRPRPPSWPIDGRNVIIATGTASGKSLAYLLPALSAVLDGGTVLYLSPTKALAADQLRVAARARPRPSSARPSSTATPPFEERDWVRQHANYVLTNPDMLHRALLPRHARWSAFFRRLRMVVVDECHGYRGVFGSHVAQVLRRLRRVCARYGSAPGLPARLGHGQRARGLRAAADRPWTAEVTDGRLAAGRDHLRPVGAAADRVCAARAAPRSAAPPPRRRRPARRPGRRGRPDPRLHPLPARRRGRRARRPGAAPGPRVDVGAPADLPDKVAAYRAGYLPEDRRGLERALRSGDLLGLATTTALELGVDVSGPGRRADRGLARHPGVALAAGGPGRARRAGRARGADRPGRPAGHLPGPPPGGAVRPARSRRPCSTRTTRTCSARTCARPPPSSR